MGVRNMNETEAPVRDFEALLATVREFARSELRPVSLHYDETEEFPWEPLHRAAELGLTCYDLPREYGGGGVESLRERCAVIEELAEVCVVFATVAPGSRSKGITAFVVEKDDPGFVIGRRLPKLGSRCFPAGELAFEDCAVPADRRLGEEGRAFSGLMRVFDDARVQVAANSLGVGRAALEHAVAHARERRQFGHPIHEFQAVSFRLVDAKVRLDQARLLM